MNDLFSMTQSAMDMFPATLLNRKTFKQHTHIHSGNPKQMPTSSYPSVESANYRTNVHGPSSGYFSTSTIGVQGVTDYSTNLRGPSSGYFSRSTIGIHGSRGVTGKVQQIQTSIGIVEKVRRERRRGERCVSVHAHPGFT